MIKQAILWLKNNYHKVIESIAFYPAFIACLFLASSAILIAFDFSDLGMTLKSNLKWLQLEDANTARSIISAIAGGVISLTVFSFSMVMIVLNQAASQMSNRVLDKLIGNRFQQVVLGIYIGTIVYAFFLLSTISDLQNQTDIPSISTLILIALTVFDIFLFIYFLHYITQSVKYEVIIKRIFEETKRKLKAICELREETVEVEQLEQKYEILCSSSGIFQGLDEDEVLKVLDEHDCEIHLLYKSGTFLIKSQAIAVVSKKLPEEVLKQLSSSFYLHTSESINYNPYFGFKQLTEVAVKALSPGVNDPGTATVSMRSLLILFAFLERRQPGNVIRNENKQLKIVTLERSFDAAFEEFILPIWDYGHKDRLVQLEFKSGLEQLNRKQNNKCIESLLENIEAEMNHKNQP